MINETNEHYTKLYALWCEFLEFIAESPELSYFSFKKTGAFIPHSPALISENFVNWIYFCWQHTTSQEGRLRARNCYCCKFLTLLQLVRVSGECRRSSAAKFRFWRNYKLPKSINTANHCTLALFIELLRNFAAKSGPLPHFNCTSLLIRLGVYLL